MKYNEWPGGTRHAMYQSEHDSWNALCYPGTRQICCICDEPTGRCEFDSLYFEDNTKPLCERCYERAIEEGGE